MSIKTKEELMASLKEHFGDDTSDETLAFIEDVQDTLGQYEQDGKVDWKRKYEENDKTWRQKYRDRFFSGKAEEDDDPEEDEDQPKKYTYESLFKTE